MRGSDGMKALQVLAVAALVSMATLGARAADKVEPVQFEAGKDSAVVAGELGSEKAVRYVLGASEGQYLTVNLNADNKLTYFTVYDSGGDIVYESTQGGSEFYGQLARGGDTAVEVFYKGEPGTNSRYEIAFTINAGTPGRAVSTPAGQPAPIDPNDVTVKACLAAVGKQTNNSELALLGKEFSEANSRVMIGVGPNKAPWSCLVSNDGVVAEVMFTGSEGKL